MESILKHISGRVWLMLAAVALGGMLLCSCESAFPNDKLDNFWRLERMEFAGGTDLLGQPANSADAQGIYFGMARNIIQIENHARSFDVYGVFAETADSIRFDFTESRIKGVHDADYIQSNLLHCGVDSLVCTFRVESLTSSRLVLSTGKVRLNFEKW